MAKTADYNLGSFTYPRGWFMIARADELGARPLALRYFGQDFVLYRGESGRPYLVEAYCPHAGAHLAVNSTSYIVRDGEQVSGESIRCPFHGWRFGPDGVCDEIPYGPCTIPKAARLKTWPVEERAGIVWMWHDPEGGEPDVALPPFAEWDMGGQGWVRWQLDDFGQLAVHPVEIVDNMGRSGGQTYTFDDPRDAGKAIITVKVVTKGTYTTLQFGMPEANPDYVRLFELREKAEPIIENLPNMANYKPTPKRPARAPQQPGPKIPMVGPTPGGGEVLRF